jgi:hypothetical protein
MRARILLAAAILLVAAPAFAADADTIAISPLVQFLGPAISTVIASAVTAVLGLLFAVLQRYFTKLGVNVTDDQWAVVQRTAAHWAAQWWAQEDSALATAKINVSNPQVAAYANFAINEIPQIATALGLTPAKMREFIVAEVGKLQAKVTTVAVSASPPSPVAK